MTAQALFRGSNPPERFRKDFNSWLYFVKWVWQSSHIRTNPFGGLDMCFEPVSHDIFDYTHPDVELLADFIYAVFKSEAQLAQKMRRK